MTECRSHEGRGETDHVVPRSFGVACHGIVVLCGIALRSRVSTQNARSIARPKSTIVRFLLWSLMAP